MNRTSFLIDGFNLYHSLIDASHDLYGKSTKWLDICSLCESCLPIVGNVKEGAMLEGIFYFSALAFHRLKNGDYGVVKRHLDYLDCLEISGVKAELRRFKEKNFACPHCKEKIIRHEEKETDVAIAIKLFELFHTDLCDTVVLVTGDTDLVPAAETMQRRFSDKLVLFAFPYRRKSRELSKLAPASFKLRASRYLKYQFPQLVEFPDGTAICKPDTW